MFCSYTTYVMHATQLCNGTAQPDDGAPRRASRSHANAVGHRTASQRKVATEGLVLLLLLVLCAVDCVSGKAAAVDEDCWITGM